MKSLAWNEKNVIKNEYGFWQIEEYPSDNEIEDYYKNEYYNGESNSVTYQMKYTKEELNYLHEKALIWVFLIKKFLKNDKLSILDVGCGEGFSMRFFHEEGYEVSGLDFSVDGIARCNPEMLPFFEQGNTNVLLEKRICEQKKYDVILLQNVLEHVTDPKKLLELSYSLLQKGGLLLVEVPNDFNPVQQYLVEKGKMKDKKWVCLPDHMSYFNKEGLNNLCVSVGFNVGINLCTEMIELFGFNEDSNYFMDSTKGRNCHTSRMEIESLIHEISMEASIDLYEKMAELGIGRNLLAVYKK